MRTRLSLPLQNCVENVGNDLELASPGSAQFADCTLSFITVQ
jgi:hypothetical protein